MNYYDESDFINIGTGKDSSIRELAEIVANVVGFEEKLRFDTSKPDGTPQKLLDVSRLKSLGWSPRISLKDGIKQAYEWCMKNSVF
jgi:GDP-L-fucose synthase